MERKMASAIVERHMFPRQTNRTETGCEVMTKDVLAFSDSMQGGIKGCVYTDLMLQLPRFTRGPAMAFFNQRI